MNMDKKNDLIETYRRREDEFRLPPREGTWEKLEEELAVRPFVRPRRAAVQWLSSRRTWMAAAAVLLCALLSLPFLLIDDDEGQLAEKHLVSSPSPFSKDSVGGEEEKEQAVLSSACPDTVQTLSGACPPDVRLRQGKKQSSSGIILAAMPRNAALPEWEDETERISVEEAPVPKNAPRRRPKTGPEPEKRTTDPLDLLADARPVGGSDRSNRPSGWAISLQAGSSSIAMGQGSAAGLWDDSVNDPGPTPPPFEDPEDPNKPDNPDHPGNQPEKPDATRAAAGPVTRSGMNNTRYRHRLPVSFSLSARKMLSRTIAVESGLTYTVLRSDITDDERGDVGEQSLHYIGIPLKFSWIFWQEGRFSAYLSAGGMAEYGFSASRYQYNMSEKVDMNRWDFSANVSLGVQVELVKPVSLFVEPGVGHYFDTNRHRLYFESVRTERPTNFSLQIGVRFSY